MVHQVLDPFRLRKLAVGVLPCAPHHVHGQLPVLRNSALQVARYHKLILERLDNEPLLAAFGVDAGFNMQVGGRQLPAE